MRRTWGAVLISSAAILFAQASFAQNSCDTDFNGDGTTDVADFEVLKAALGASSEDDRYVGAADLNGDGWVTTLDYQIMLECN